MKRLLCWCICLFGSGQMLVAGGWWSVAGEETVVGDRWSVAGTNTFRSTRRSSQAPEPTPASHQPPTTDHLPCTDSSPACLTTLGNLAVQNNREIAVVEQAIQLQMKKLWTHWLNADGLNPIAIGLRIVRNVAGGGDRAAAKLEIARLTARRAELETNLRQTVRQAVWESNAAIETAGQANLQLLLIEQRIKMAEVAYRMGESSTEAMLALWETQAEARARARLATPQQERMQEHLRRLVFALP